MFKFYSLFVLFVSLLFTSTGANAMAPNSKKINLKKLPTQWHATRLAAKDFRLEGNRSLEMGEPYHLVELMLAGEEAVPFLLDLLHDNTPTKKTYFDYLAFRGLKGVENFKKRTATIGDFADYALRKIYRKDVKYRSYLSEHQRGLAIDRWKKVVVTEETTPVDPRDNEGKSRKLKK